MHVFNPADPLRSPCRISVAGSGVPADRAAVPWAAGVCAVLPPAWRVTLKQIDLIATGEDPTPEIDESWIGELVLVRTSPPSEPQRVEYLTAIRKGELLATLNDGVKLTYGVEAPAFLASQRTYWALTVSDDVATFQTVYRPSQSIFSSFSGSAATDDGWMRSQGSTLYAPEYYVAPLGTRFYVSYAEQEPTAASVTLSPLWL